MKRYLVVQVDITDMKQEEADHLEMAMMVQAEDTPADKYPVVSLTTNEKIIQ